MVRKNRNLRLFWWYLYRFTEGGLHLSGRCDDDDFPCL